MRLLPLALTAGALVLAGCSAQPSTSSSDSLLETHDLTGKSPVEIIEYLDEMPLDQRPADLMASVRLDELLLTDPDEEISLDLPEDSVYVSIAPYVDQTHDCFYHSLTTCQGELSDELVDVEITDEDTGEVLVDEEATTFDNGFIGYWLPRDTAGTIEVTHGDQTGTVDFTTTEEAATCITTLQLSD